MPKRDPKASVPPQFCPPLRPLPEGHPQRVARPRGAGSEVRERYTGQLTDAQAERVLRAIYSDDEDDAGNPGVSLKGAALIVAACTVGACVLLVALAYVTTGW